MASGYGTVLGTTKLVDNGPDTSRFCLLIAGDGFTASEQSDFQSTVGDLVPYIQDHLTGPSNWEKVNVIRLDVESDESGVDVDTYFGGSLGLNGVDRGLTFDQNLLIRTADTYFPEWDTVLLLINTTQYAGSATVGAAFGGGVGASSLDPLFFKDIVIHELGHCAFGLADEYNYLKGCDHDGGSTDDLGTQDIYPNADGEPIEPNVTKDYYSLKWGAFVDPSTPIPTTKNQDCAECDLQLSPVANGTVGAFEGAHHYHCNIWRPEYNCRMRLVQQPFCTVCNSHIGNVLTLASELDPTPCFVATVVYGDRHHPDVVALRHWRDRHLAPNARGRAAMRSLVAVYDRVGPHFASAARQHPGLARLLRRWLIAPVAAAARRGNGGTGGA